MLVTLGCISRLYPDNEFAVYKLNDLTVCKLCFVLECEFFSDSID